MADKNPRRPMIAGNWKLHNTVAESLALVTELKRLLAPVRDCDVVVAPSYTALFPVVERLRDSNIAVAAQELFYEDKGAFTGAVSAAQIKDVGATYVLVGHSERRQIFGESLESSHKRVQAALRAGLLPIICIGETLEERNRGATTTVVGDQLEAALGKLTPKELQGAVIAYEPVWAIGTGQVATPQQAQEVHHLIRQRLRNRDAGFADSMRLLYGGSVKPDNAAELLRQPDIDGALVGGASLSAESFAGIVKARG